VFILTNRLSILEAWFEDAPYDCTYVSSPFDAYAKINEQAYDVVVSDINMPVMNGPDLMKEVRIKHPNTMRIVMSGQFDVTSSIEAINKGRVFRYLVKPFENKEIKIAVYEAIQAITRDEKEKQRVKEFKKSSRDRIKQMSHSLQEVEGAVKSAQDGVFAAIQNMVLTEPEQHVRAELMEEVLESIFCRLDLKPESERELAAAGLFLQVAYDHGEPPVRADSWDASSLPGEPVCRDEVLKMRSQAVLSKMGFQLASDILDRMDTTPQIDASINIDHDDGSQVGCAILRIAMDLVALQQSAYRREEALRLMSKNRARYGQIYADIFKDEH